MILIAVITWVPTGLIEIGVLLQIIAIVVYLSGTTVFRRLSRPGGHGTDPDEENRETEAYELPEPNLSEVKRTKSPEEIQRQLKKLGRTSKTKFVQSFKFRE